MTTEREEGRVVELFGGPMDGDTHWFGTGSLSLLVSQPEGRYVLRRKGTKEIAAWEPLP